MRLRLGLAFVGCALGALWACSSSPTGSGSPSDGGTAACSNSLKAINDDGQGNPLCPDAYDKALEADPCSSAGGNYKKALVHAGACGDYLEYDVINDPAQDFYRCYYSTKDRTLVGMIYADGSGADQCNSTSITVQAGSVEPWCSIASFDRNQNCQPPPDAGPDHGGG